MNSAQQLCRTCTITYHTNQQAGSLSSIPQQPERQQTKSGHQARQIEFAIRNQGTMTNRSKSATQVGKGPTTNMYNQRLSAKSARPHAEHLSTLNIPQAHHYDHCRHEVGACLQTARHAWLPRETPNQVTASPPQQSPHRRWKVRIELDQQACHKSMYAGTHCRRVC